MKENISDAISADNILAGRCSVYMIKPEAFLHRAEIRSLLQQSLLVVSFWKTTLDRSAVLHLYPDLTPTLLELSLKYLCVGDVEFGIVAGPHALTTLVQICGASTDPSKCSPNTIRSLFGCKSAVIKSETAYYRNAFHCSRDLNEVRSDLALISNIKRC